ncbi:Glu/Leu/Phe/Val dehydrogenase dimerization domain-containing protein (plasmid) [Rhodococcus globerulus]|uniref:Glu/Leu/Phe/Val dehydrogenase dimerization domain-containing protein n=1 Tax=Rhodococcus globerulus TaxID=33008 RepID=UPI0039EA0719
MTIAAPPTLDFWSTEQLVLCSDDRYGLHAVIAVDNTALGKGLGGVRFKEYANPEAGVTEARRLARAMSFKNAAADLSYGGAKSVIFADGAVEDRAGLMRRFGEFVARTGMYLPGVDMGTSTDDLKWMAEGGASVPSIDDNPSASTATGVYYAIKAAVDACSDLASLSSSHLLIQGVGNVGEVLARRLAAEGARLTLTDVDSIRAQALAHELGAQTIDVRDIPTAECDVFVPCAVAKVIDSAVAQKLRCVIVAGAANDTLSDDSVADILLQRKITYVPDFLANAGGVIDIDVRYRNLGANELESSLEAIGTRVSSVLAQAESERVSPLVVAHKYAQQRITDASQR